jgi:hypothetical protein
MPVSSDPVPAITEASAEGATAALFAEIRATLDVGVVNLIWRHLATMPGALEWVWGALKPLYLGAAPAIADETRQRVALPTIVRYSDDTLAAAGLDDAAVTGIRNILESYHHTNALALVVFSAFLSRIDGGSSPASRPVADRAIGAAPRAALPRLTPISEMPPAFARLVDELNGFGEDADSALTASMYRHLSHWPVYLALTRTLLAPLHRSGELLQLVTATRALGATHGQDLASAIALTEPPRGAEAAVAAVRRFVTHPIARMTGICALMRAAMPE